MSNTWVIFRSAGLLVCSNIFMTMAWYGHLKFRNAPLWLAIAVSWLLALPEYALQVPANRLGYFAGEAGGGGGLSAYQLKILQEAITLVVFMVFSAIALGEAPGWRQLLAFGLVIAAVAVGYSG